MRLRKRFSVCVGLAGIAAGTSLATSVPFAPLAAATGDEAARCTALVGTVVVGAKVEKARYFAPGAALPLLNIPTRMGFCQARAAISPVPSSRIEIEIWLPERWNSKMLGLGGSGVTGGLVTAPLTFPKPVADGYVVLATDAGHEASEVPNWALKQPERIVDYGYRGNHLGAVVAKALTARYYGTQPKRAYFQGCSNGGRDALMLAQRFPDDYDGIVAGAPANNFVSLMTNFANYRSLIEQLPPDSLTPKAALLHEAALKKCDALDGAKDGLIDNANACKFDPGVLSCKPGQDPASCLSPTELKTVRTIYSGSRTRSGKLIHPGLKPGTEYLWPAWVTSPKSTGGSFAPYFFGYFVYDNPSWTMASFNMDKDWMAARKKLSATLDATNTDLRPFVRKGGKLLMYHGWDDQAISPDNTISYYSAAKKKLGRMSSSAQLFMVPGMGHCFDGKGLTSADFVGEMDRWVEKGTPPQQIIAEKPVNPLLAIAGVATKPLMARPICAWPKSAHYKGTGSMNEESSFVCQ